MYDLSQNVKKSFMEEVRLKKDSEEWVGFGYVGEDQGVFPGREKNE